MPTDLVVRAALHIARPRLWRLAAALVLILASREADRLSMALAAASARIIRK